MSTSSQAPVRAIDRSGQQFEIRCVAHSWAGDDIDLPVVPVRFIVRAGGGWWLQLVGPCPFCGDLGHQHGSNLDADWNAKSNGNPLIYASAPKYSHCTGKKPQGVYVNEIVVSSLPMEARQHESETR